ncbi:hypothetical protein LSTR_LSTR014463 [Laodelphax striatellus]|uniref:Cytoplasmic tRNA 2-thiolation protein 1 C-terminal domain-containing protein n=1 Tax=Laodelphax striatellus TaxID=195883 RepID=A0A482XE93_LAOST|nr:hypothetical protein LSTR_LSTR014463 [Laodelphax striatellus]
MWKQRGLEGERLSVRDNVRMPTRITCTRCGLVASQAICKACTLLEGLNRGLPRLGIGKESKTNRMRAQLQSAEAASDSAKRSAGDEF